MILAPIGAEEDAMNGKKIRVPSTTVDLIQILGTILRDHLELDLPESECWTFEYVTDWEIYGKEDEWSDDFPVPYLDTEAVNSVYLGTGKCWAFGYGDNHGNAEQLDLRVRCQHSRWITGGSDYWDFQLWIKTPDGTVRQHRYTCNLWGASGRDIFPKTGSKMPQNPPRKIAFWRQEEARIS